MSDNQTQKNHDSQQDLYIQTKDDAHKILFELSQSLQELIPVLNGIDSRLCILTINQIEAMRRTIDLDDNFFNMFFLAKTKNEIIDWIENESKKWE